MALFQSLAQIPPGYSGRRLTRPGLYCLSPLGSAAGPTTASARDGAGMTTTPVETAGEGGGDGLRGSRMNASAQATLGDIMPWKRSDRAAIEQKKCLPIFRSVIEPSERPTAVVGQSPSGKSRLV